jgi:transposase
VPCSSPSSWPPTPKPRCSSSAPSRSPTAEAGFVNALLAEVATELGLSPGQLSAWRTEHLAAGSAEALAARKAEEAETLRLKRENKRLEEENLILKKAAAFFARGIA